MAARALVYKSQSAEALTSGRWALAVWVLYHDDALGPIVQGNPQQVNVEIDPTAPATWKAAIAAAVVERGAEMGLDVTVTFSPVFG